jgi:hypothetical protein
MLLMRMLKQNHIKLVIILFLNDEVQTNLYLYIRNNDMPGDANFQCSFLKFENLYIYLRST